MSKQPRKYFALRMHIDEAEIELWSDFHSQDKADLSRKIYTLIRGEMGSLRKAALESWPRAEHEQPAHMRRIFLLALPEFEDVIRFIQANVRRPAFRKKLKSLVLYGECAEMPAQISDSATCHLSTDNTAPNQPARPSPRTIFEQPPAVIIKAMVTDLHGDPESLQLESFAYDWLDIPPEQYPAEIRRLPAFSTLEKFWAHATGDRQ